MLGSIPEPGQSARVALPLALHLDAQLEVVDECSEVSATEGAPAGITMMDFFEPPCVAVSSTQPITLTNAGNLEHNFTVGDDDFDIDVEPGGEETTDEVGTDLAAGT